MLKYYIVLFPVSKFCFTILLKINFPMTHFSSFLRQRMDHLSINRTDLAARLNAKHKAKAYRYIDAWLSGKQLPNNQQVKVLAVILQVSEAEIVSLIDAAKLFEASQKVYEEQKKRIAARKAFLPHIGVYRRITTHHMPLPYFTTDNKLQDRIFIGDDVLKLSLDELLEVLKVKIEEYISENSNADYKSPTCFFKLNLEYDKHDGICVDRNATLISEPKLTSEVFDIKRKDNTDGILRIIRY